MQYGGTLSAVCGFPFFGGTAVPGKELPVITASAGTAHQGGKKTSGKFPASTLLFFVSIDCAVADWPMKSHQSCSKCRKMILPLYGMCQPACPSNRRGLRPFSCDANAIGRSSGRSVTAASTSLARAPRRKWKRRTRCGCARAATRARWCLYRCNRPTRTFGPLASDVYVFCIIYLKIMTTRSR